jgi:hypothetical protein
MSGEFYVNTQDPSAPTAYYDCGYAQFGSDYYSYSNNNAAKAANNAASVVANTRAIAWLLEEFLEEFMVLMGLSSMFFGFVIICAFGIVFASCFKKAEPCAVNVLSYPVYKAETPTEEAAE